MLNLGDSSQKGLVGNGDARVPLLNLTTLGMRMNSVQSFLSESVNRNILISKDQMDIVSSEIASAIHQIIVNGAALLSCAQNPVNTQSTSLSACKPSNLSHIDPTTNHSDPRKPKLLPELKTEEMDEDSKTKSSDYDPYCEIVELDAMELLAEHIHFCEICGKGFKRDANLRMHMRAHGNKFKTPEALAKPLNNFTESRARSGRRFSCPYEGCNRNKTHKKFKPLKSMICLKNHFKRSHCPKMYSCNRCNKKSFSVVADLKSHSKHCGEAKWRCSCGTTFSRKDKLFGHMSLFEGHMPAVMEEDENEKGRKMEEDEEEEEEDEEEERILTKETKFGDELNSCSDDGFFEGLLDGFGSSVPNCSLQDLLGFPDVGDAEMGALQMW